MRLLRPRHLRMMPPRAEIREHLRQAGIDRVAEICQMQINGPIINALVERWRPETHTFHLPCGECTVTLEDVAILLGLRIDGLPVIGSTNPSTITLQNMCDELLGGRPGQHDIEGSEIKLTWLTLHLGSLHIDSEIARAQYVRGYILSLLGHILMPTKSNSVIHGKFLQLLVNLNEIGLYSWGSASLAFLYRGLDRATRSDAREICGCMILLQLWVWNRLPWLAPIPAEPMAFPLALR